MFLRDPDNPLETALEENAPRCSNEMSYSISQVSVDMKPKIFGIFTKIGFNELPGLAPTDYIWLANIERYFGKQFYTGISLSHFSIYRKVCFVVVVVMRSNPASVTVGGFPVSSASSRWDRLRQNGWPLPLPYSWSCTEQAGG